MQVARKGRKPGNRDSSYRPKKKINTSKLSKYNKKPLKNMDKKNVKKKSKHSLKNFKIW